MSKTFLVTIVLLCTVSIYSGVFPSLKSQVNIELIQQQYTEIKMKELPAAVLEALNEVYPDAVVLKVYVDANKEYKMEVTLAKGTKIYILYVDGKGKWKKIY